MKIKKTIDKNMKRRKQAAVAEREFIVNETFSGTKKLAEIFSDLLYAEYCRREKQNGRKIAG